MKDALHNLITSANAKLEERLVRAKGAMETHAERRVIVQTTDAFLVNASRHTAAICDLVLPAVRAHVPEGRALVHRYVVQCKRSERAIIKTKQRMYGEARSAGAPWAVVWSNLVNEVRALHVIEQEMMSGLSNASEFRQRDAVVDGFEFAADHSPTRPHPNSPHTGLFAHASRRMWLSADRFWDAAEGRIVWDGPRVETTEEPDAPNVAA
ncbi:MAG: hypothetical protein ABIN55_12080 [Aeromicrobium sp.]